MTKRRLTVPMVEALHAILHPRVQDHVTDDVSIDQRTGRGLVLRGLATEHQYGTALPVFRPTDYGRTLAERIGRRFSEELTSWLTPDEMALVNQRNRAEANVNICHSHDVCDANMAMDVAWREVIGRSVDATSDADATLWGEAWDWAKARAFSARGSFKVEVQADSSGTWAANSLRFQTVQQAEDYARDLFSRWTAVRKWRVVPSPDAVTEGGN